MKKSREKPDVIITFDVIADHEYTKRGYKHYPGVGYSSIKLSLGKIGDSYWIEDQKRLREEGILGTF